MATFCLQYPATTGRNTGVFSATKMAQAVECREGSPDPQEKQFNDKQIQHALSLVNAKLRHIAAGHLDIDGRTEFQDQAPDHHDRTELLHNGKREGIGRGTVRPIRCLIEELRSQSDNNIISCINYLPYNTRYYPA